MIRTVPLLKPPTGVIQGRQRQGKRGFFRLMSKILHKSETNLFVQVPPVRVEQTSEIKRINRQYKAKPCGFSVSNPTFKVEVTKRPSRGRYCGEAKTKRLSRIKSSEGWTSPHGAAQTDVLRAGSAIAQTQGANVPTLLTAGRRLQGCGTAVPLQS